MLERLGLKKPAFDTQQALENLQEASKYEITQLQDANIALEKQIGIMQDALENREVPPRHRVCSIKIDPVRLTAELRAIESSLRVEWEGTRFTVYSDGPIIDAQTNAVIMKMQLPVDLT